jgi:hypothetical protein
VAVYTGDKRGEPQRASPVWVAQWCPISVVYRGCSIQRVLLWVFKSGCPRKAVISRVPLRVVSVGSAQVGPLRLVASVVATRWSHHTGPLRPVRQTGPYREAHPGWCTQWDSHSGSPLRVPLRGFPFVWSLGGPTYGCPLRW